MKKSPDEFSLRRLAGLLAGVALVLGYAIFELRLPRGPAEFAFWPPLEPLPFAAVRGFTWEQLARFMARLVLLGPALLLVSWGLAPAWPQRWTRVRRPGRWALVAALLGLAFAAWAMFALFGGRAVVDDELTYTYQAQLVLEGRLAEDRLPQWITEPFTVWTERGATGKYLFGEPLLQIPGLLVDVPGLLHLPIFALTLLLWFRLLEKETGTKVASWATVLLAVSPMVLLTTGTGMSNASSLFCMVAAGWGLVQVRHGRARLGALVAGLALGLACAVRVQVAVPFGGVLALFLLVEAVRRRRFDALAAFVLGALPWLAAIALYNHYLTGSIATLPWSLFSPRESYGFGAIYEGTEWVHTPLRALENLIVVAVRLNAFLLGWPLSLGLLAVWWGVGRPLAGARPWLWAGLALTLFNLGYYSPGISGFGALYHHELVLPFSVLGGHAIVGALGRWPRLAAAAVAVHLTLGTGGFLLEQSARLGRMVTMTHGPAEAKLAEIEPPALLIYEAWPTESTNLGWLSGGFPKRDRRDTDPIVMYPRSGPAVTDGLRSFYSQRACWYYRIEPRTIQPELRRCEDSERLLDRPFVLPGSWISFQPTAMKKGLLPRPTGD